MEPSPRFVRVVRALALVGGVALVGACADNPEDCACVRARPDGGSEPYIASFARCTAEQVHAGCWSVLQGTGPVGPLPPPELA